ncbi:hypothetical protein DFH09DRAFT_1129477, partial [Mycena vulgaris]
SWMAAATTRTSSTAPGRRSPRRERTQTPRSRPPTRCARYTPTTPSSCPSKTSSISPQSCLCRSPTPRSSRASRPAPLRAREARSAASSSTISSSAPSRPPGTNTTSSSMSSAISKDAPRSGRTVRCLLYCTKARRTPRARSSSTRGSGTRPSTTRSGCSTRASGKRTTRCGRISSRPTGRT